MELFSLGGGRRAKPKDGEREKGFGGNLPPEPFSLSSPPPTMGSAPGPQWRLCPEIPVIPMGRLKTWKHKNEGMDIAGVEIATPFFNIVVESSIGLLCPSVLQQPIELQLLEVCSFCPFGNAQGSRNSQDTQLSQRDRAARCVIVLAKSARLELGDNILRTLKVYLQPM